ncbi:MAG: CocE/NonD family hydrolase [Ruminococcaceae bacterium]|nr:CocE/NonD family hydrolase [Oscillospiraceae bacterium]
MITNKLGHIAYSEYVESDGCKLFTVVTLPEKEGKFPTVIMRSPYVDNDEFTDEETVLKNHLGCKETFLNEGFAVVDQHCRGRGKSEGIFVPFIDERKDGLNLHNWIRKQNFYDGSLYLFGGSYTSAVHLATAPFASDIKGALLEVMTTELYHAAFRNGIYKVGLHGIWFEGNFKNKQIRNKNISENTFLTKPFSDYPEAVFGERSEDFMDVITHYKETDAFWNGGSFHGAYHDSLKHNRTPILFTTGWYDIFVGGMIKMWEGMDEEAKNCCSLTICPYDHSLDVRSHPMPLKDGMINDYTNCPFRIEWFKALKNGTKLPLETGKVTYYRSFDDGWSVGDLNKSGKELILKFGEGEVTYTYNPNDPTRSFKGGLSHNFGSTAYQEKPNSHYGVKTFYTEEFNEDVLIKGQIKLNLPVKSNCEDTGFYVRLSITKEDGDYAFRDDITKLSNFNENYIPGEREVISFTMEPHCIKILKGEKIRVDISSSAYPQFLPHTNVRGEFYNVKETKIARNTLILDEAELILPIE